MAEIWHHGGIKTSTTPGTPVQLTTTHTMARAITFLALPFNTNRTVIGEDNTVRAGAATVTNPSGTVLAILGAGTATGSPPSAGVKTGGSMKDVLDCSQFWLDVVTSGEGVIWSFLEP